MRLCNIAALGGTKSLLIAVAVAMAALLLAATGQAQAQNTCRPAGHLGTLGSNQTVLQIGTLTSETCYYTFDLAGQGSVTVTVSTDAFSEFAGIGTADGAIFAHSNPNRYVRRIETVTRTLPAGRYSAIAGAWGRNRGGYELRITTGDLEPTTVGQTEPPVVEGDGDALTVDSPTVVRGRVIARVHPLPENDRRGDYRIEFGFLSEGVLTSGTDRTAVVAANEHLLPPRRYLNEASMLERAQANDRSWLRSSPIDVLPLEGNDTTLSGEPLLTGRVIARWNPTSGGRFRVEFGFLPEWAFAAAGGDTERAARMYANLLPDPGRYLTESRINSEASRRTPRWLTSSLVGIPQLNAPRSCGEVAIMPIAVPLTLPRGERITNESIAMISGELGETFTPVTVQGLPPGLDWDLAETSADGCEHHLTVSGTIPASAAVRNYSVQITAEGADGERTTSTIQIGSSDRETGTLRSTWGGYSPATALVSDRVRLLQPRVTSPLPAPSGVVWQFRSTTPDICSVNRSTGALTLIARGACRVTITASASGYTSDTATTQVKVLVYPTSGFARCAPDEIRVYYFDRGGLPYNKHHIDIRGPEATAIFGELWWDDIARFSAAECRDWLTGDEYDDADSRRLARELDYPR